MKTAVSTPVACRTSIHAVFGATPRQFYFNNRLRVSAVAMAKAIAAMVNKAATWIMAFSGTSPSKSGRASCTACDSGNQAAIRCSVAGNWSAGKNTPDTSIIGVMKSVK